MFIPILASDASTAVFGGFAGLFLFVLGIMFVTLSFMLPFFIYGINNKLGEANKRHKFAADQSSQQTTKVWQVEAWVIEIACPN